MNDDFIEETVKELEARFDGQHSIRYLTPLIQIWLLGKLKKAERRGEERALHENWRAQDEAYKKGREEERTENRKFVHEAIKAAERDGAYFMRENAVNVARNLKVTPGQSLAGFRTNIINTLAEMPLPPKEDVEGTVDEGNKEYDGIEEIEMTAAKKRK